MKKKNVVILHLESLSNEILKQEHLQMPGITSLIKKSLSFNNFYTTATSSILAFTDFCYGNDYELDNSLDLDNDLMILKREKSIFEILEAHGFKIQGIAYPKTWRDDLNNKDIWHSSKNTYDYNDREDVFLDKIECFLEKRANDNQQFALHVWDIRSHLFYSDQKKEAGNNFFERRSLGYKCIDDTACFVLETLEKLGLLENTIVIGYGDHGDELWSHSLNGGFCHAIEPYTSLIHTPCFIFDKDLQIGESDKLVGLTDLKWTILSLLDIQSEKHFNYSGKNIFKEKNSVILGRNLLANQRSNYNSPLRKGYSATNKEYHLMVSEHGLEMYAHKIDPANTFNLLNYFNIKDGELIEFHNRGAWHTHFRMIMKLDQIQHMQESFKILYQELFEYVKRKNNLIHRSEVNEFHLQGFNKIKEKIYHWNA